MKFQSFLDTAGEHPFQFSTEAGNMEGMLTVPETINSHFIAVLGHPHSLQGGSMNNKVVTTMARTFRDHGIPSLRFNFRGVGASEGEYDAGIGESHDMLHLCELWQQEFPEVQFIFAGFSFGSYVTYRAAAQHRHRLLISIAPPVHHYNYHDFSPAPYPWLIVQGIEDEVVPAEHVLDFVRMMTPEPKLIEFEKTGHFFHRKLIDLKNALSEQLDVFLADD